MLSVSQCIIFNYTKIKLGIFVACYVYSAVISDCFSKQINSIGLITDLVMFYNLLKLCHGNFILKWVNVHVEVLALEFKELIVSDL